jgi:hypothetical protein
MRESYFDKVREMLDFCDRNDISIYANIYKDGDNEGEEILVVDDSKSAEILDELFRPIVKELCEKNGDIFRDYSDFSLEYITGDQWTYADEGFDCSDCYKFYRYDNGWGGGYANYFVGDGFIVCEDCLKENYRNEWLEEHIDNPNNANTIFDNSELREMGFEKVNDYPYANGMYHGETDNPKKILEKAKELYPDYEFLFSVIKDYNPFHTEFNLFRREIA